LLFPSQNPLTTTTKKGTLVRKEAALVSCG